MLYSYIPTTYRLTLMIMNMKICGGVLIIKEMNKVR